MTAKTLKELRALARSRGLKGYSKLPHTELERLLAAHRPSKPDVPKKSALAPKKTPPAVKSKPVRVLNNSARDGGKKTSTTPRPATPSTSGLATYWAGENNGLHNEEQRVENAKYAMVPPGNMTPAAVATDLDEDIDSLPAITEPMLCLLPQKPGVLHGYWVTPPGSVADIKALRLRLGRLNGDSLEIIEEIPLPQGQGHWYFRFDESADVSEVYLQLGYYERNGSFVSATRRGIARIPSLYASGNIDRLWWISDEQFRAMYLRAGGFAQGPRLAWNASTGSPGGVSSQQGPHQK
ncbi:MAG: hypothetical protein ACYDBW_07810 [Sulfuricaulis sp.]